MMTRRVGALKRNAFFDVVFAAALAAGAIIFATERLQAQEELPPPPAEDQTEVLRGVMRISWQLIDAIADDQVTARVPFDSRLARGTVAGDVESKVDMTIVPYEQGDSRNIEQSVFRVIAQGNAQGNFSASAGCFRIAGPIAIPFRAERNVLFDGRFFEASEASVDASVHTRFASIRTRRNGPLGRLVAGIAAPAIRGERSTTEQEAAPVARRYVLDFIERYTKDIVTKLNQVTPLEESLFKLYPEMADWRIRVSSHDDYLEARYAPPEAEAVPLPEAPHQGAAIEIWIRTTLAEARILERLGQWQHVQELIRDYLPEEETEARNLTSNMRVASTGPWFVLLIGSRQTDSAGPP